MNEMRLINLLILMILTYFSAYSQTTSTMPSFTIKRKVGAIKIDGKLNDAGWENTPLATNFTQRYPDEFGKVAYDSEVRLTYDDKMLYIAIKCEKTPDQRFTINSLKRDFSTWGNDAFTIRMDPFQDKNNAFAFTVSPYGVQRESIIANGGRSFRDVNTAWDNKWYNKNTISDDYWVSEIAIPFTTLRFKTGAAYWNINFLREDTASNQTTCWAHVPRNFSMNNLNYAGKMYWDVSLQKTSRNFSLIPYVSGAKGKNYIKDQPISNFEIGGDVKYALTPALNLDLTFNPDFSQVEVDRQVSNLSRFEVYLPERRQFFLENADLFASFGDSRVSPFFSRRIGMIRDQKTRRTIQGRVAYGLRLTGKTSLKTRIGLINTHTLENEDYEGAASENHTVFAIQQRLSKKSNTNIGLILINKETFKTKEYQAGYNRVAGVDYNYANAKNTWGGKASVLYSFLNEQTKNPYAHIGNFGYNGRNFSASWTHRIVGEGFTSQSGFVRRTDYKQIFTRAEYQFFYKSGFLNTFGIEASNSVRWGATNDIIDRSTNLEFAGFTRKNAYFGLRLNQRYVFLRRGFDPSRQGGKRLEANTDYQNLRGEVFYSFDRRKPLSGRIETQYGQYYNGHYWLNEVGLTYNYIPRLNINISGSFTKIYLPKPYKSAALWLTNTRVNYSFNQNVHLMAYFQYNTQTDFMGFNLRFQWRFAPASDFFLVYNDSYLDQNGIMQSSERAVMAKLLYWINI